MVDMVLLLHGQHQPLGRIQPHLAQFFTEHFLQGREPTEANIPVSCSLAVSSDLILNAGPGTPPKTVSLECLSNQLHLIRLDRLLMETPKPVMGSVHKGNI